MILYYVFSFDFSFLLLFLCLSIYKLDMYH